ncbi:MAG: phosphotransferase, partial [Bacteroidales bacterium]|nr:phosphotransferase [Bacteroidales bacterium]
FDRQSMQWDLNYFKYYFLKLAGISFDEQLLEDDFQKLIDFLLQAGNFYFLFRDFQSRNIMIFNNEPYFIDYQGGRRGALQYDIASLLYDGKADLSPDLRNELLEFYLSELSNYIPVRHDEFLQFFDAFALIRIMQAFGTYGFRGYYEKKAHFLLSIPYAIRNIKYILDNCHLQLEIPELFSALRKITESELSNLSMEVSDKLTVEINSFSYKKGIPMDYSGNGGGFVFDCRALPNPGREKFYQDFTGKDKVVADYLEKYDEVSDFKDSVFALVKQSVDNYLERKFNHLSVSFGCTGGQHRSVYFAESLSEYLQKTYKQKIKVILQHTNLKG